MDTFSSNGVNIAYSASGSGDPVLLLHGFAGTSADNWLRTGWLGVLERLGRQIIMMDARGHGQSEKPHTAEAYRPDLLIGDVVALMDHLQIEKCSLLGFSMGAAMSLLVGHRHPDRVTDLMLLGIGDHYLKPRPQTDVMIQAFRAASADQVSEARARSFRLYAESLDQDLDALAAYVSAPKEQLTEHEIAALPMPTLWIAGTRDDLAGPLDEIQNLLLNAHCIDLPGIDHVQTLSHGMAKAAVADFLTGELDLPPMV